MRIDLDSIEQMLAAEQPVPAIDVMEMALRIRQLEGQVAAAREELNRGQLVGTKVTPKEKLDAATSAIRVAMSALSKPALERYLHGEAITADEAKKLIETCRRCTECQGEEHHWMGEGEAVFEPDVAEDVAEFRRAHPQLNDEQAAELAPGFECCKHCPAVRLWQWDADDYLDEDMERDALEEE